MVSCVNLTITPLSHILFINSYPRDPIAPCFQFGHPKAFELANRISEIFPEGMNHVFFTNSGSEAVDTTLKIALAYHRARGKGTKTRCII